LCSLIGFLNAAQLRNVADWAELDAGNVSNNQLLWEGAQEAFKGQDESYNNMHFEEERLSMTSITLTSGK